MDVREMDMDQVVAYVAELSEKLGEAPVEAFDSLGAARLHAMELEARVNDDRPVEDPGTEAPKGDKSKYDTSGRRGPNLGTGAYAKQRIAEGADNKTILAEIHEKFPTAKTSMSSIAFYRNALKKGSGKSPEALRAQAGKLRAQAADLEAQADAAEKAEEAEANAAPAETTEVAA